jgi:hypothetical protein
MNAVLFLLRFSSSDTTVTEQVGVPVSLCTSIWKVLGSSLFWDIGCPD